MFGATETRIIDEIPSGGKYVIDIAFPTVADDDIYDFQLIANPYYEVELSETLFPGNSIYYRTSIEQKIDSRISFEAITTDSSGFGLMPTAIASDHTPGLLTIPKDISISWTIAATDAAAGGALVIKRQPVYTDFGFIVNHKTVGDVVIKDVLYLDSIEGLSIGMVISNLTGTSGSPTITSIDKIAKSVTISDENQTWNDGEDAHFTGNGSEAISKVGATVSFSDMSVELVPFTATVNGATSSSTTITLDSAYGIKVHADSTITGIGFDNSTPQAVTAINYAAHAIQVTSAQSLQDNTILTLPYAAKQVVIKAKVKIIKVPESSLAFKLDLDNILTSAIT